MNNIILAIIILFCGNAIAETIPLKVFNDNATSHSGYVSFSAVPISSTNSTSTIADLKITSDSAGTTVVPAQFDVLSRYDNDGNGADSGDKIRTVLVNFKATVAGSSNSTYYLQVSPGSGTGGNASGSNLVSDESGYHQIATGSLTARIKETAGWNLFDRVTVDATDVVSAPSTDGAILASGGNTYTSYDSNDAPTVSIIYNGPLFSMVKVSGHLETSANTALIPTGTTPTPVNPVSFDTYYWAYKDERTVHVGFRLKNENPAGCGYGTTQNANVTIDHLSLQTTLAGLGTVTEVDFGGWSDTTSPSGEYSVQQDHCLPGTCAQASESDSEASPNFNYYIKEATTTRYTGRRFGGYSQMRDANRGLMIAAEYHWQNWPMDIVYDATNKLSRVYLLPDESSDHTFLAGAWKFWHVAYNFHDNVASDYAFTDELAEIKKPLKILLGNQIAFSDFYADRTPPTFTTSTTGGGGEPINDAITNWDRTNKAQYDSAYSDDTSFMRYDMLDIREMRPVSAVGGALNGPVDMYGWLPFGDWVRGAGAWGMGALNYGWNQLFVIGGHKYQIYGMLQVGDQMSVKTADQLITHAPIDSSTVINSSGVDPRRMHGAHAGELDADTRYTGYVTSYQNTSRSTWKHGFPDGLIIDYMLSGKPWLLDSMRDAGDFLRYNYSNIAPDHGKYGPRNSVTLDTVTSSGTYWEVEETRVYSRSMGMAVGLYQATGDTDYYTIAKGIFNEVLLDVEIPSNSGYLSAGETAISPWYVVTAVKPSIMLYNSAIERGDTAQATVVGDFLVRMATWYRRVGNEDMSGVAGVYSGGNYFPWTVSSEWSETTGLSALLNPEYVNEFADLFAFAYTYTSHESWLTDARDCFKDMWFYSRDNTSDPINTTVFGSFANDGPQGGDAWLKEAKNMISPMYYLRTEYGPVAPWSPSTGRRYRYLSISGD